ncbi:hypothetical protein [Dyella japonica]|uniref:Uncharacterized protein n=1 Tax=Dyella japonica TaxID=231455 RepID=A0ABV2K1J6_9GAMM
MNTKSDSRTDHNNIVVILCISLISFYFYIMPHEVLGHGVTMFLFGHRQFLLNSTSIDNIDSVSHYLGGATFAIDIISVAGSFVDVVIALVLGGYFLKISKERCSGALAYFVWTCAVANMFAGVVYPGYSAIFGVGDFAFFHQIHNAFYRDLLRAFELAFSIVACLLTIRWAAATLPRFSGNVYKLTIPSYFFVSVVYILVGLRMHDTGLLITSTIPTTLLGMVVWPLSAILSRGTSQTAVIEPIRFSWLWVILASICIIAITMTAPGIHIKL